MSRGKLGGRQGQDQGRSLDIKYHSDTQLTQHGLVGRFPSAQLGITLSSAGYG